MNARGLIDFFKTQVEILILFLAGVGIFLAVSFANRTQQEAAKERIRQAEEAKARDEEARNAKAFTTDREIAPAATVVAPRPSPTPRPTPPPQQRAPLRLVAMAEPTPVPPPPPKEEAPAYVPFRGAYAPFGRLIPCELVNTVDSSAKGTPVIGIVTRDVYWDGRLVIPADSEVHGKADVDKERERVTASGLWTVILSARADGVHESAKRNGFPDSRSPDGWGGELVLKATALDMEFDENTGDYGITDGSAGLKGRIIRNDASAQEIKLFAATFIAGLADGMRGKSTNVFGTTQYSGGMTDGIYAGAEAVLNEYADRIASAIKEDGFYVRVPAGKQFYLYVEQSIDTAAAGRGNSFFSSSADINRYDGRRPMRSPSAGGSAPDQPGSIYKQPPALSDSLAAMMSMMSPTEAASVMSVQEMTGENPLGSLSPEMIQMLRQQSRPSLEQPPSTRKASGWRQRQ